MKYARARLATGDRPRREGARWSAAAFECVAADGVDNRIEGPGGQLRANAVAFHDRLGTQRPNAFDVPGARGSIDAGAGFLRHLRRAGADAARRAAHQDRLSRFDPRVLEQHLPRGNGDDGKARRCDVVERGGLARDLTGLDQRLFRPAAWPATPRCSAAAPRLCPCSALQATPP